MIKYLASQREKLNNDAFNVVIESNNENLIMYVYSNANPTNHDKYLLVNYASEYGHLKLLKCSGLLGTDVTKYSNYALRYASKNGHLEVVKYLVSKGADITSDENYSVQVASENNDNDMVNYLISQGAKL